MAPFMKVNGLLTKSMALESILGPIKDNLPDTVSMVCCMVWEDIPGQMAGHMRESTKTTKKKASVFTPGTMARCIEVLGEKESNTD